MDCFVVPRRFNRPANIHRNSQCSHGNGDAGSSAASGFHQAFVFWRILSSRAVVVSMATILQSCLPQPLSQPSNGSVKTKSYVTALDAESLENRRIIDDGADQREFR
jgi:hypothetical protein